MARVTIHARVRLLFITNQQDMKAITLLQPQKIVFGTGCIQTLVDDYKKMGFKHLFVLTAPPILPLIEEPLAELKAAGISIETYQDIVAEPTVNDFKKILEVARGFKADSVIGIGGVRYWM